MVAQILTNHHADYSPVILRGSAMAPFYNIIFGGATQTGKSSRADALVARAEQDFVYGPKAKIRPEGVTKEGDNERPDSIILTPQTYGKLKKKGIVLETAEYTHGDTRYVPLKSYQDKWSAVPDKHHVIYVALTNEGVMRTRETLVDYNPLTFLFYTRLETLRKRLDASKMNEAEKVRRLQEYTKDFAQFRVNTDNYLFLFHVKSPAVPDDFYLNESARFRAGTEILSDADNIVALISKFNEIFQPSMSYLQVHQAFVEKQVKTLFKKNLDSLDRMLIAGEEVRMDLSEQTEKYLESGNYLSDNDIQQLSKARVVGLIHANGRHTLLIKGLGETWSQPNGHRPLEDILIDFVEDKLGALTVREDIRGQRPSLESNFGLVKVIGDDVTLKDSVTFSLGNTHLVDNSHPSLSLVFAYTDREDAYLRKVVVGMDSLEVKNLEERTIQ